MILGYRSNAISNVPITSIAVSSEQNASGVFELNFRDECYIPFEGAGAIGRWRIELPKDFRQFDHGIAVLNSENEEIIDPWRYPLRDG
ncbi:MAG TPA: hypothetical protein VMC06_07080 [Opitutaceae bacterium]|nr:hypothetical protein [Opitutaceae bacterium]